jgi:hypothetical protein
MVRHIGKQAGRLAGSREVRKREAREAKAARVAEVARAAPETIYLGETAEVREITAMSGKWVSDHTFVVRLEASHLRWRGGGKVVTLYLSGDTARQIAAAVQSAATSEQVEERHDEFCEFPGVSP